MGISRQVVTAIENGGEGQYGQCAMKVRFHEEASLNHHASRMREPRALL